MGSTTPGTKNRGSIISGSFYCGECAPHKLLSIALRWTSTGDRESIEAWKSFSASFLAISRVTARILVRHAHCTGEPSRRSLHIFQWWAACDICLRCKCKKKSSASAAVCEVRRYKHEVSEKRSKMWYDAAKWCFVECYAVLKIPHWFQFIFWTTQHYSIRYVIQLVRAAGVFDSVDMHSLLNVRIGMLVAWMYSCQYSKPWKSLTEKSTNNKNKKPFTWKRPHWIEAHQSLVQNSSFTT